MKNCKYNNYYGGLKCNSNIENYTGVATKRVWKDDFNEKGDCPHYKPNWLNRIINFFARN